jgi:phosphatidylglycerophosphate synthase
VTEVQRAGSPRLWGPANLVTAVRAALTVVLAVLVVRSFGQDVSRTLVVTIAVVALATDAVDGRIARRTGTVSRFGARFDMETDAALLLVLSTYVARSVGLWVLAIGLARYVFLAAKVLLPWLRGEAPPRSWCKVVAALQGIALVTAASGLLSADAATIALLAALALLTESFAHEAWDLWRERTPHQPAPWAGRLTGLVACLVVWVALVAPDQLSSVSPAAFARIPLEGLVLTGLVLLLPGRIGTWVTAGVGLLLGVLTLLKVLDIGVSAAFARPFDPLGDPLYAGAGVGFLRDSLGAANAYTLTALAVVTMVAVLVAVPFAVERAARVVRRHRPVAGRLALGLALVWAGSALVGVRIGPDRLAAATDVGLASAHVEALRGTLHERARLEDELAHDPWADVPGNRLLDGLRGKDVFLVFVESYGKVALDGLPTSPLLRAGLDADSRRLAAAGFGSRSAFLTSPTYGGLSWLAHSTMQSGLWIDSASSYNMLLDHQRLTLSSAFGKAGWRSVGVIPADTATWPQGQTFYHWSRLLDSTNLAYHGPMFGFSRMPDQYALQKVQEAELDRPGRGPLMGEIDLESSHSPWVPLPQMIEPSRLGDGSVYFPIHAEGMRAVTWPDPVKVQAAYVQSLQYSLDALTSWVEQNKDDDLVMIVLGDHWPIATVSGTVGHDVPVSIIAKDPAVLDKVAGWGWQQGLRPHDDAPVARMDTFRNRFLATFSTTGG